MKVKDIITLAFDFCHEDSLALKLREGESLEDDENEKVDAMVRFFNLVNEEIASGYLPMIVTEKVKTEEGNVDFSNLSKRVIDIVEVRNSHGRKMRFRKFNDRFFALASEVNVSYKTLPSALTLTGEFSSTLPERVFAYGVAREYFYFQGATQEGDLQDVRFKDSLLVLLGKSREIILPVRRWI